MTEAEAHAEGWPGVDGPPTMLAEGHGPRYVLRLADLVAGCLAWVDAEERAGRIRPQHAASCRRVVAYLPHFVSGSEHCGHDSPIICTSVKRLVRVTGLSRPTIIAVMGTLADPPRALEVRRPLRCVYKSRNGKVSSAYTFNVRRA